MYAQVLNFPYIATTTRTYMYYIVQSLMGKTVNELNISFYIQQKQKKKNLASRENFDKSLAIHQFCPLSNCCASNMVHKPKITYVIYILLVYLTTKSLFSSISSLCLQLVLVQCHVQFCVYDIVTLVVSAWLCPNNVTVNRSQ